MRHHRRAASLQSALQPLYEQAVSYRVHILLPVEGSSAVMLVHVPCRVRGPLQRCWRHLEAVILASWPSAPAWLPLAAAAAALAPPLPLLDPPLRVERTHF